MSAPSSDTPKMASERVCVMRERAAFLAGVGLFLTDAMARRMAKERFPLKIERPRIVQDRYHVEWRVGREGEAVIQRRHDSGMYSGQWTSDLDGFVVTAERVALWSDLLARPTELVDDEEAGS